MTSAESGAFQVKPTERRKNEMDVSKYYPSPFVKADDLNGTHGMVVESWSEEELTNFSGKSETKLVVTFAEPVSEKGPSKLVLNRTRLNEMIAACGTDTNGWVGKTINIFPGKTRSGTATVSIAPPAAATALNPAHVLEDDEDLSFEQV